MVPLKGFREEKKQIQDFRPVMGKNRAIDTEASEVPIGLAVAGANRHDSKMAEATI